MQTLENFKSFRPPTTDTWEVDHFDVDCEGNKLAEPLLGVRVNGGTWLEVRALLRLIEDRQKEIDGND